MEGVGKLDDRRTFSIDAAIYTRVWETIGST